MEVEAMEQREPKEREFVIASERNGEYPFTREDSFERKMRRHRRRHAELGEHLALPQTAVEYFEQVEIEAMLDRAELTPRQRYVCEQYLRGWTLQEIGNKLRISKQAVAKTLKFAVAKLKRAWETNPYRGLAEVYRYEVTRYSGVRR
jgi:DNA-directed RNA polymerase sigma subunit (sigma70/sigma32)